MAFYVWGAEGEKNHPSPQITEVICKFDGLFKDFDHAD